MSILAQLKRLSKDTFSYGLSSALQKLITMFLFPIYARLLTPADFGVQDIVLSVVSILVMFLILGLDSGVMLYYYEADDQDKKKLISTYLWFEVLVALPVIAITMIFAAPICAVFFKDASLANYLRLGVVSIPFSLVVGAMLSTLRLTFQTNKFVILTTVGILLQVGMAILLVIVFKMGVSGILISILISNVLQAALGAGLTYRNYHITFSNSWLKKLLKVGIPLIPAALSFWVMSYANRFFLVNYANMEEVGLLSIVNRISSILLLFLSAFSSAWGPYAYSIATDKELARQTYRKVLTIFTLFSMTSAIGLSLYSRELILVLATSVYERGASLVFIYSLSAILWVALYIIGMGTGMAKKNYHYTISVIAGALLNTLLNYLLIPPYGVTGAAYATLAGNLIATIYMYFAGQHYFRVNYEFRKLLLIILITIGAAYAGNSIDAVFSHWSLTLSVFKFGVFCAFVLLLFVTRVLSVDLLRQGLQLVKGKFSGAKAADSPVQ